MIVYETITINGTEWRYVKQSEDPKLEGCWKCSCGQIIKQEKSLEKHLQTLSHTQRLQWLCNNRPMVRFLS